MTGPTGLTGPIGPTGSVLDTPITTSIYVDFLRADSYVASGSHSYPFKTLADAYTLAATTASDSNPKMIVLLSGNRIAEHITFSLGNIFLIGENSSAIVFTGSLTFTGPTTTLSSNHFAITGLSLIGVSDTDVLTFSGSNPQRLFMRDVWITTNGASHGINMTNTDSESVLYINDSKFTLNGSEDYHCLNINKGTCHMDTSEISGTLVVAFDASLNISNSNIKSSGRYAIELAGGTLSLTNTKIITTATDSIGITITSATATAIVNNLIFSVPLGVGMAISSVASSVPYGLYYGPMYFLPGTNSKITSLMARTVLSTTITLV